MTRRNASSPPQTAVAARAEWRAVSDPVSQVGPARMEAPPRSRLPIRYRGCRGDLRRAAALAMFQSVSGGASGTCPVRASPSRPEERPLARAGAPSRQLGHFGQARGLGHERRLGKQGRAPSRSQLPNVTGPGYAGGPRASALARGVSTTPGRGGAPRGGGCRTSLRWVGAARSRQPAGGESSRGVAPAPRRGDPRWLPRRSRRRPARSASSRRTARLRGPSGTSPDASGSSPPPE